MDIILIDNYDSFTYNLLHYLEELGAKVRVVRNDALSAEEVLQLPVQAIVLSPGPCDPDQAGICLDLLRKAAGKLPLLGVCLGHQALAQAFGGKVIRAIEPKHGKISRIFHQGKGIFAGIPSPFNATRYHSLIVERHTLPSELTITAETEEGIIMGLEHTAYGFHGVQFHPESIASEYGHKLLENFLKLAEGVDSRFQILDSKV